jgi:hypothetical protein
MLRGTMTPAEAKAILKNLNIEQRKFLAPKKK